MPQIIKLFFPNLSYTITGILFEVHNEIDRCGREKQYGDLLEMLFKKRNIVYKREFRLGDSGNIIDFIVEDRIVLELKAKRIISKNDYYQIQRYLQMSNKKLELLINFREEYIKPKRIIKIDNFIPQKLKTKY